VRIFGLTITRAKAAPPGARPPLVPAAASAYADRGWYRLVKEPYTGAWQQDVFATTDNVLTYGPVFACVTLIASDIAKLCLRLVLEEEDGIWTPVDSPAFSPVLRRPNRYQTTTKFLENWISSKAIWGNTYVLLQRDRRGIVVAMYVLNPAAVRPLVAPDGAVYYELSRDDLAELPGAEPVTVPASEIIHDTMVCLYHPLCGVSPIYACATAALQGLKMQGNSAKFFANNSQPGGILLIPGAIAQEDADEKKAKWKTEFSGDNYGSIAVLADGMKYQPVSVNPVDAQLIEQLKWTAENVCSCYHVPAYMIGVGPPPPYANVEPLLQQYYSQCLQSLIVNLETSLDHGLGIDMPIEGTQYGTELDIDDLYYLDTKTRTEAGRTAISSGALSPNEARQKYYGARPVVGGDSPMVQQQYYSLESLAKRDASDPFAKPTPAPKAVPPEQPPPAPAPPEKTINLDDVRRRLATRYRRVA